MNNNENEVLVKQVKEKIEKGDTGDAIKLFLTRIKGKEKFKEEEKQLLLISNNFHNLNREKNMGTIDANLFKLGLVQITEKVLNLVSSLEDQTFSQSASNTNSSNTFFLI